VDSRITIQTAAAQAEEEPVLAAEVIAPGAVVVVAAVGVETETSDHHSNCCARSRGIKKNVFEHADQSKRRPVL
jgi:hypothetical protein